MATTKAAVVLAAAAFFSGLATTNAIGVKYITLYDGAGFTGAQFNVNTAPYTCIDVLAFNDRASSAKWFIDGKTGSTVSFYEHENCQGAVRTWPADAQNFPVNFAIDGIDNMVSSVKVRGGI